MPGKEITQTDRLNHHYALGNISSSMAGSAVGINTDDPKIKKVKDKVRGAKKLIQKTFKDLQNFKDSKFDGNFFSRRGQFYEPLAIRLCEICMEKTSQPGLTWQNSDYPWLYATPDGIIDEETVLEVKNPYAHVHEEIPPHYMAQMQLQMNCSNRKKAIFVSCCVELDRANIFQVEYSQPFFDWIVSQLKHIHECLMDGFSLNMTLFDLKPPEVKTEIVKKIDSIKSVFPDPISAFPEKSPFFIKNHMLKKRKTPEDEDITVADSEAIRKFLCEEQ